MTDRSEWPVHQPRAWDAPIPGIRFYAGCDDVGARVTPEGRCEGCGTKACPECGRDAWPECGCGVAA